MPMEKLHRNQLIAELKNDFPELTEALNAEAGLLSFELSVFCRFTMAKIGEGDRESVAKCYAIDTCYVEELEFPAPKKKDRTWAWDILPEQLKVLFLNFHG